MRKIVAVGMLLFLVVGILALPAFAADEKGVTQGAPSASTILEPARLSLINFLGYMPQLTGLLLILVIGSLIAVGIAALIGWFFKLIKLEKGAQKIKIPAVIKKGGIGLSLSELIGEIAFFLIIIVTLITALGFYGVSTEPFTAQLLSYIPQVIAGVFILVLGILLAILISGIIKLVGGNVRIAQSETLGNIAKYAIVIVAGLIALKEFGLSVILTDKTKDIILGGLTLGFALAFGLGAKDKAGDFLNKVFKK
jgi:hypothetical protein